LRFTDSVQVTANTAKHQVAVTIVTVQELFNGWVGRINDPSLVHNLPALYSKLWTTVLPLSLATNETFVKFPDSPSKIGRFSESVTNCIKTCALLQSWNGLSFYPRQIETI